MYNNPGRLRPVSRKASAVDRQNEVAMDWSVLKTIIWISSRSDELVDRRFSLFREAETVFSNLVHQGARFPVSFAHARDVEFPLALKGGLVGIATEAHLLSMPYGFLVAPKGPKRVEIPGRRLGCGTWKVADRASSVPAPMVEGASSDANLGSDTLNVVPWTGQRAPVLVWRPDKSEVNTEEELFVDVEFNRENVRARWPPPPEQEARRLAEGSPLSILQGLGKELPVWDTYGSWIPLDVAIEFLAFGQRPEQGVRMNSSDAEAPQAEGDLTGLTCLVRAEQAIFAAARDGKIDLHGRAARASGATTAPMSPIAAAEFATKRRLATNSRSDIARDETRPSYFLAPAHWTDVVVERLKFQEWMQPVPASTRTKAKASVVSDCFAWLVQSREAGPPKGPKAYYEKLAREKFPTLGPDQFLTEWRRAANECPKAGWSKPGRPSKGKYLSD